jgi:hypothetical protein
MGAMGGHHVMPVTASVTPPAEADGGLQWRALTPLPKTTTATDAATGLPVWW